MTYRLSKRMLTVALIALVVLWWGLGASPSRENFHDRGVGACPSCDGNFAGYKNTHSVYDVPGYGGGGSCLYSEPKEWCYDKPQEWADPPPLDYRMPKDVCFC